LLEGQGVFVQRQDPLPATRYSPIPAQARIREKLFTPAAPHRPAAGWNSPASVLILPELALSTNILDRYLVRVVQFHHPTMF
jgi:hypothetical protein